MAHPCCRECMYRQCKCLIPSHRSLNSDRDTGLVSDKTLALTENLPAQHLNEGSSHPSDRDTGSSPSPWPPVDSGAQEGGHLRGAFLGL